MPRNAHPDAVAVYALLLPHLRTIARQHGYALGLHGSLTTDMDLIAAPWVDSASAPDKLIAAFAKAIGGTVHPFGPMRCSSCTADADADSPDRCTHVDTNPSKRAHGRLAYAIHFGDTRSGPYFDVSVMPRMVIPE